MNFIFQEVYGPKVRAFARINEKEVSLMLANI